MLKGRRSNTTCSSFSVASQPGAAKGQAGFSLVELLVSIIILAEVLVGLLIIFDSSSRLARAQTHVAELQQSLRVGQSELTRYARMAGLGGLPITPLNTVGRDNTSVFPEGPALSLFNNVEEQTIVQLLDSSAVAGTDDVILPGSDVLILRGVFSTPMFYVDPPLDISTWVSNAGTIGNEFSGQVILPAKARTSGRSWWDYPQEIEDLADRLRTAMADEIPLALILRDTLSPNSFVIAAFDFDNTVEADLVPAKCSNVVVHADLPAAHVPQCIQFNITLDPDESVATGPGAAYAALSAATGLSPGSGPVGSDASQRGNSRLLIDEMPDPDFALQLPGTVGSIGLLEEYRLFVRAEWEIPGQTDTRLTPVLARAEFLPGTNTLVERVDIADNVLDLQIAIGGDADPITSTGYGSVLDNGNGADEILFNSTDDVGIDGSLTPAMGDNLTLEWEQLGVQFHFLRINTLVQARFPDRKHRAPRISVIEDYDRGATFEVGGIEHTFNDELLYRRRWLQTMIELRNLL